MLENMMQTTLDALSQNWIDSILLGGVIFFVFLGALRGFGRTFVYSFIFFSSALFALWWFTPYLRTFTVENIPALLVNLFYFWAGNTMIAWMATKVVMALDSNGTGAISRVGGAFMGGIYAVGLLITANTAYAIALPDVDRLDFLPDYFAESVSLQKSDALAENIYNFLDTTGLLEHLTSRELKEEEPESTLTD